MEFKLITPKPISETYFKTNLSRFGLAGLLMKAILDIQFFISLPVEELQTLNSEFKLITPKPNTGTYFDTKLSRFGWAGSARVAILKFSIFISQQFEGLQCLNLDFLIIIPKYFYGTLFASMSAILDFFKRQYISCLKSYRADI